MLAVLLVAACLGCITGAIAQGKGRSFVGWWLFGTALFVIALPCALMASNVKAEDAEAQRQVEALKLLADSKPCPFCAERIKAQAVVCRHCGRDLPTASAAV